jgi:glycosyltransferase involved in cell wall biosynthesis
LWYTTPSEIFFERMSVTGRIAILHYASPPTIGGVESMIEHQARGLADLGYTVRVVTGRGGEFDPRVETCVNPLFSSSHPDVLAVKTELDAGQVSPAFYQLEGRIQAALSEALSGCAAVVAHNISSLHKNLPLTGALKALSGSFRLIAWCNDLAWTNTQYLPELYPGEPWDWLRTPWPGAAYVTISESRRVELSDLLGIPPGDVTVIPPGIDPARFFRWSPATLALVNRLRLLDADGILLLPARLTRRKNIALALRVLAAVREQSVRDFRLVVTGPPGPHNPANPGYLGELLEQRHALNLDEAAHFLYTDGTAGGQLIPDDDMIADLYRLADALFFPSLQEGFGIPMLEAGLSGLPIFCADIPPLRATGGAEAIYFDPVDDPPEVIANRLLQTLDAQAAFRLRGRVRRSFRWERLLQDQFLSLLEDR